MLVKLNMENDLRKIINVKKLTTTSKYTEMDMADINDFPKLEINDIKNDITFGYYVTNLNKVCHI